MPKAVPETPGYTDQDQKDEQLEALRIEYETHARFGRKERAAGVAAYAKEHHGADLAPAKSRTATQSRSDSE